MSETQLASMFIGSADDGDGVDRGRPSDAGNMIHIVNPQTGEILDYITLDNIIEDTHKKSLESYLETYDAIVLGGNNFSYDKHLEKRNHIIIPDEDGTYQEFILFEVEKYRDTEGRKTHFYAHATYLELKKAKVIYPARREGLTLSQHAGWALNDTGWTVGIVEAEGTRTFNIENHTNPYEFIKRIANEFEVEIRFRVEHDGRRITARYVDFLERIGDWKGREVEFGKDLDSIRRIEKQDVVTALLGLGPERDDGTRIEVLVEDEEALQRWGRVDEHGNLHHLIEPYEIQSDRQEMTEEEARQYTRTALNKRINTQVTYETTILDLEEVPGLEHEKIRFGDTIRIKDTYFNPPLYLEARVFEIERSIKNKAKKDIKLGDYIEYTEEEVHAIWRQLRNQIRRRITAAQLIEYAEPKKVESSTPPPIKEGENPIWVDTSKTPHVPHVVIANEWVKMTPTTAEEVDAYTKQQTDEIAEDASRLKKGIIDVNQVPLRTSITGARIEWDGINGLVQYNADGEPVSWLDLEGNAHFENGYFKGEIHADKGSFSGNITGASGTFGEVTVNEGDITIKDAFTNVRQILTPKPNLIGDHSFEEVLVDWDTEDTQYNWYDMVNPPYAGSDFRTHRPYWTKSGSPKVAKKPYYGVGDYRALPIFDVQAIVVRDANFVRQYIADGIGAGGTYTISGYFKRHWGQSPGIPRFEIDHMRSGQRISRLINQTFERVPNDYTVVRFATTFTLPSNFQDDDYLDIKVSGGDSNWVQCDGVQLVEGNLPCIYDPEITAYEAKRATRGFIDPLWEGAYYLTDTQTVYPMLTLTECRTGWILRWQAYNVGQGVENSNFQYVHIPKITLQAGGRGHRLVLQRGGTMVTKYIYVYDTYITGHEGNGQGDNRNLVLTGVFEY